jgi:antitoxin YefM
MLILKGIQGGFNHPRRFPLRSKDSEFPLTEFFDEDLIVLSGIKQQVVVGKNGKIEIETSELAEGIVVEVIVLVEKDGVETNTNQSISQDATEYLLSTEANRYHLMTAIQNIETKTNLVNFTLEEWNEEYNIRS